MPSTVQDIFDLTVDLIDERLASGAVNATTTAVYKARTPGILNLWQNEMAIELLVTTPTKLTALTDNMNIDYPNNAAYFLASHLLLVEDPSIASFFNEKFIETKQVIIKNRPATIEPIIDVYADENDNAFNGYKGLDDNFYNF